MFCLSNDSDHKVPYFSFDTVPLTALNSVKMYIFFFFFVFWLTLRSVYQCGVGLTWIKQTSLIKKKRKRVT